METTIRSKTRRSRLLRFSLFSFFSAISLVAAALGWIRHRAEQQRLAVEWILSQGGEIRYNHYRKLGTDVYYSTGSPEDKAQRAALRPENSWLANTLGAHYVHRIERVLFQQSKLKGEVWRLRYAYGAKEISFWKCNLTGDVLKALGQCRSVEELSIGDCQCNQAGLRYLASLPKLKHLYLDDIVLDDGGLEHLGKCLALESLDLTYCKFPADDLAKLRPLSKLTHCGLGFTSVNDSQLVVVAAWPNLQRLELGLWCVADGWELDLFLGRVTPSHADVELAIFRQDQALLHRHFSTWELEKIVNGQRHVWSDAQRLELPVHQIHARSKRWCASLREWPVCAPAPNCTAISVTTSLRYANRPHGTFLMAHDTLSRGND